MWRNHCNLYCKSCVSFLFFRHTIWLSTAPFQSLTHWYQVRVIVHLSISTSCIAQLYWLCHCVIDCHRIGNSFVCSLSICFPVSIEGMTWHGHPPISIGVSLLSLFCSGEVLATNSAPCLSWSGTQWNCCSQSQWEVNCSSCHYDRRCPHESQTKTCPLKRIDVMHVCTFAKYCVGHSWTRSVWCQQIYMLYALGWDSVC